METRSSLAENRLRDRSILISNLDRYIEESIYYRTHFSEVYIENKKILFNISDQKGRVKVK